MKQVETLNRSKGFSPLRRQRELRCWSLERVAEELDKLGGGCDSKRIGKWELGKVKPGPFYREKLCELYGVSADQLGFTESQPDVPTADPSDLAHQSAHMSERRYNTWPRASATGYEDMFNGKRRELLRLLSVATSALVLPVPELDWDRLQKAVEKPRALDDQVLKDLVSINQHYWRIYRAALNKEKVLDGILGQLKTLLRFLPEPYPASQHKQLCEIASDLGQLAGECLFDINHYDAAQACYVFAANAAKDANHYDLWSCALVRHAFLPIYEAHFEEALPLLQGAQHIAHRGDTMLATRFWVANVTAQAHAGLQNLAECQRNLDFAEEVRVTNGANGMWLRFDSDRLAEERGSCFVKLGQPEMAIPVLQQALEQHPDIGRRRGMILTDLATATLQRGKPDDACLYADEAVQIAQQKGSGMLVKGLQSLQASLAPYRSVRCVSELEKKIAVLN